MNSERRHELNENELAGALGKINHSIEPYSKPIAVGVVAFFVVVLAYGFYASSKSDNRSDATLQLIDASITGDTESLATIAAQYPDTAAAAWSRLYQGGQQMAIGITSLFNSPEEAETLLDDAAEAYNQAMRLSDDAMIQSRAQYGLAQIAEARGDVEDAIKHYESAMAVGESKAMIAESKARVELLSSSKGKEFLAWFETQDFSPADPSLPPSLPGASDLPDLPTLDLPPLDLPMDDTTTDDTTTEDTTAEDVSEMTEDAPTEDAPTEDAPTETTETSEPAPADMQETDTSTPDETAKTEEPAETTEAVKETEPAKEEAKATTEEAKATTEEAKATIEEAKPSGEETKAAAEEANASDE